METKVKSGNSIASFVLGLISVILSPVGPITGIVGLINGIVSRAKKQGKKGLGIAGIVLNSIGIVLGLIVDAVIIFIVVIVLVLGVTTVGTLLSAVALINESGIADTVRNDINWSEFDASNLNGSLQTMMVDYAKDKMMGHYIDAIQSEEGMVIKVQGHTYRLQGDTFASIMVVDEETGEVSDIQEFLVDNSENIQDIKDSLESEYGMNDEEFQLFVYSALEGEVEVLGDESVKTVFGEDAEDNLKIDGLINSILENNMDGFDAEEWVNSMLESGDYEDIPFDEIMNALGVDSYGDLDVDDLMNSLNNGMQYQTNDPFSTTIEGVDLEYMLKLIIEAILSSEDLQLDSYLEQAY